MSNGLNVSELGQSCCNRIDEYVMDGRLSNDDLLQIIAVCGDYLNLKTRAAYASANGVCYNTAKNHRRNVRLFEVDFVVDNY